MYLRLDHDFGVIVSEFLETKNTIQIKLQTFYT